jgi:hypothetical protein
VFVHGNTHRDYNTGFEFTAEHRDEATTNDEIDRCTPARRAEYMFYIRDTIASARCARWMTPHVCPGFSPNLYLFSLTGTSPLSQIQGFE